ncbi:MAG: hypothetical protein QOF51_1790 [Chloroflexota bacterium]|jgi:hypothetical protein|nr:hypothetical protein [Chloroflexota bacterium]
MKTQYLATAVLVLSALAAGTTAAMPALPEQYRPLAPVVVLFITGIAGALQRAETPRVPAGG